MEMDLGTGFVSLLLLILCIVPFVIIYLRSAGKDRKSLQALRQFAQIHQARIDRHEVCGHLIIGLDNKQALLFFMNQKEPSEPVQTIRLSDIRSCSISRKTRPSADETDKLDIVEKLQLRLSPKQNGEPPVVLELYDESAMAPLNGEMQFAEKWSRKINERLAAA